MLSVARSTKSRKATKWSTLLPKDLRLSHVRALDLYIHYVNIFFGLIKKPTLRSTIDTPTLRFGTKVNVSVNTLNFSTY